MNIKNRQNIKFNYKRKLYHRLISIKSKFKSILSFIKVKCNIKMFHFFKNYYTFVIYNFFEIKYYIIKYVKDKYGLRKDLNFFFLNKYLFISIFYNIFFNYNKSKFNFFTFKLNKNNSFIKLLLFNLLNLLNSNIYSNIKVHNILNTKLLLVSANFMRFYINYNYIKTLWSDYNIFNKRNYRRKLISKYKYPIIGYKMAFHGRFSRKQKSSSI